IGIGGEPGDIAAPVDAAAALSGFGNGGSERDAHPPFAADDTDARHNASPMSRASLSRLHQAKSRCPSAAHILTVSRLRSTRTDKRRHVKDSEYRDPDRRGRVGR